MASRCAVIAGASGLVGGHVKEHLQSLPEPPRIVALGRSDYDDLGARMEGVTDVYACLGTTLKKAGSEEAFRKVDYGLTLAVAKAAKAAGATRFALISSIGAALDSSSFYMRVKAETERDVEALGFDHLVVAEPSFLVGNRGESRPGEKFAIAMTGAFSFALFGRAKKYRSIEAKRVAQALIAAMNDETAKGKRVLRYEEIIALTT